MKNTYSADEITRLSHAYSARIKALSAKARELNEILDEEWDENLARQLFDIIEELHDWNRA